MAVTCFTTCASQADGTRDPDFPLNQPAYRECADHRGAAQFRGGFVARGGRLCSRGLWHPLRGRSELRRHFRLEFGQQRPSSGESGRETTREALIRLLAGERHAGLTVDLEEQTITASGSLGSLRHRSRLADEAPERLGRYRPHSQPGRRDCTLQGGGFIAAAMGGAPLGALRPVGLRRHVPKEDRSSDPSF